MIAGRQRAALVKTQLNHRALFLAQIFVVRSPRSTLPPGKCCTPYLRLPQHCYAVDCSNQVFCTAIGEEKIASLPRGGEAIYVDSDPVIGSFVFQRDEDDAGGGARSLAADDDAGGADQGAVVGCFRSK